MRIDVNLATQRYEDARQFYFRWGAALVVLLALTIGLGFIAWHHYQSSAQDRKNINEWQSKIKELEGKRAHAAEVLNRPENRDVRDQSRFWNDVIDQKSFSWTQLLSDLEKIMPARAYVVSIQPTLTPEKRLKLKLTIAADNHSNGIELQAKMEHSDHFHEAEIVTETVRQIQGPGQSTTLITEIVIETFYTPTSVQPQVAAKVGG
jgi:type IV pilus assembly protein PilN